MQINNLLVEDISLDETSEHGLLNSTLYEFRDPKWVSVHWERQGRKLGPVTVIEEFDKDINILDAFNVSAFGERKLPTETSGNIAISHRDTWTIPPWTLYVLVAPKSFIITNIEARIEGWDRDNQIDTAKTDDGQVFYYSMFWGGDHPFVFRVSVRLEKNEEKYATLLDSVDIVKGTEHFDSFRKTVSREAVSSNFWFKLIGLASKFF